MDKLLYVVAIACAVAGFVRAGHSASSDGELEAALLLLFAPLAAIAGVYAARRRSRQSNGS